jgi:ABC-2 type transport system ATP-binding protein
VRAELDRDVPRLAEHPGVHDLVKTDTRSGVLISCQVDTAQLGPVLSVLAAEGVRSLESRPPTLEELFLRHYEVGGQS